MPDSELPDWAVQLAALREGKGWTHSDLARELKALREGLPSVRSIAHMSRSDWESGQHRPKRYLPLMAQVYEIPVSALLASKTVRHLPVTIETEKTPVEEVSTSSTMGVVGQIREAYMSTIPTHESLAVSDWEEIADEYRSRFLTGAASELLPDLTADTSALQQLIQNTSNGSHRKELHRPGCQLSMLIALTIGALGDRREAHKWWQTARHVADASGDLDLRVWVRGYEAMQGIYEDRPANLILRRTEEAISIAGRTGRPCVLEAMAAQAQTLAILQRDEEAHSRIEEMENLFSSLPSSTPSERMSPRAWPETGLRHTRAWVFTHTGHREAVRAQEAAMALYPVEMVRQRTQIALLEATTLVMNGDVTTGVEHARVSLCALPKNQRTIGINRGAEGVVMAVPDSESQHPVVAEYREFLSA